MMKAWCGPVKEKEGMLRQDYPPKISGQRLIWGLAMVGDVTESRE